MIRKVKVPRISANVTDATITAWYKKEGETVAKGEPLLELTTEKTAFELESPCKGVLREQVAKTKSVLPTGYVLALVGGAADPLPDVGPANSKLIEKHRKAVAPRSKPKVGAKQAKIKERVRATPAARRVARENGIELADVKATTGSEVVSEELVMKYLESKKDGTA